MIKLINRIRLLFTYGEEIDEVLEKMRKEKEEKERIKRSTYLKLCYKHQQEEYHSHYSEQNCDYCKILKKLKEWNECILLPKDEKTSTEKT